MCSSSGVWEEQLRRRPCIIKFVHGSKISTQKKFFSAERLDGEGAEVEPTLGAHIVHALVDTPVVRGDGNGLGALALRALVGGTTGLLVDGRIGGG